MRSRAKIERNHLPGSELLRIILKKHMNWTMIFIVAGAIAAVLIFRPLLFISPDAARKYLEQGALVVDVRDAGEYRAGHLPNAVNIPLGELQRSLPRQVKDKNQVLLLHCLSGTRSGIAKKQIENMGHQNVYNLGSYRRAEKIVSGQPGS